MDSCRLCLKEFQLLRKNYNIRIMKNKMEHVFTFEIKQMYGLPDGVCPKCVEIICQFYEYSCEVRKNQSKLYEQTTDETAVAKETDVGNMESNKMEHSELIIEETVENNDTIDCEIQESINKDTISQYFSMVCDICQQDQNTYQNLEIHFRKFHGKQCYIVCCEQKFIGEYRISCHLEKHVAIGKGKQQKHESSWNRRMAANFGSMLTDFKNVLKDYDGPLPNIELALKGNCREQKNMYKAQDFLIRTFFSLDCELCGAKFADQIKRREHFHQNHPDTKYFVSCCGQRFSLRISMMLHLNKHWKHIANGRTASVCKQFKAAYYPLIKDFREELIEGGFELPSEVPKCKSTEQVQLLSAMQEYLISKHSPLNCDACMVQLNSYKERRDHFLSCHPKERLFIECCETRFFEKHRVILHLVRHKKLLPTIFPSSNYPRGARNENPEQNDSIIENFYNMICELCEYTGPSYQELRTHFRQCHPGEVFFIKCCDRPLKSKHRILQHIATHQKLIGCEQCEAKFATERNLMDHLARKHASEEEKTFVCAVCGQAFASNQLLVTHSHKHEMVACDLCGAELRRNSLRVHKLNFHKLGEELECDQCDKVFHSRTKLNAHKRAVHLGLKKVYERKAKDSSQSAVQIEEISSVETINVPNTQYTTIEWDLF
ncbi:PR domain zinc finger protein 5-like [Toxorhynchites rutilus septentrionalis]|uniref:PR domain zinc finger protein 5-like n=1 Tax=Toxorhynchites rutilus septentrionalis TaxID=329112 RepID=UPI0024788D30|nr:PR domain zinc finger protein 5-like [Toxorhynchites rutilus septentrionalis]